MDHRLAGGGEIEHDIAHAKLAPDERLHPDDIPVLDGGVHACPLGPKANSVPLVEEPRTELSKLSRWTAYLT
jgi:hypothetical protein